MKSSIRRITALANVAIFACAAGALADPVNLYRGGALYASGSSFQAALDTAELGDVIELEAGTTFAGPFILPNKTSGSGWITVRSSTAASLPAAGARVDPAVHALYMPKLTNGGSAAPVLATEAFAHHYRFEGIEITTDRFVDHLVRLGSEVDQETERSISDLPHHFVFERCYLHGDAAAGSRRGIALNAGDGVAHRTGSGVWPDPVDWTTSDGGVQVLDSYFSDFKHAAYDTQALCGWNGAGPFRIENNYLEAAGENVMFGGWDPVIQGLVPSDIEIRHNHLFKPLAWNKWDAQYAGTDWAVKNLLELKNARRALVSGNVLENNWVDDQNGFAILFTPRNQNGKSPWSVVEDVKFRDNVVRHVSAGINLLGEDDTPGRRSEQTKRIEIANNLFVDVDDTKWGGSTTTAAGRLLQLLKGTADVTIDHNTALQTRAVSFSTGAANTGWVFTNNLTRHNPCGRSNNCGIAGDRTNPGIPTLDRYFDRAAPQGNVMFDGNETLRFAYRGTNYFPARVDFVDTAAGDYRLRPDSPFLGAGTDSAGPGIRQAPLYAATGGAVTATVTGAASAVTSASAQLAGTVNPKGASTTAWFEWGTASDLAAFDSTPAQAIGSGSVGVAVSFNLSGLVSGRTYYYRVASANTDGSNRGAIVSFATP